MTSHHRSALATYSHARAAACLLKCADITWGRTICKLGAAAMSVIVVSASEVNAFGQLTGPALGMMSN